MVAIAAVQTPIPKPNPTSPFTDPDSGALTEHGMQLMAAWHARMVGTSRLIPCTASGKNLISLTPLTPSPTIEKYDAFDTFQFVGATTSDGSITATVVPKKGTLATIKVYKTNGSAQAGSGDVVAGSFYTATYVDTLDSAAGGLVLK